MIILFEGCNGVGKSSCARELSKQTNIPVYRVFRSDNIDKHWQDGRDEGLETTQEWLEEMGVPTNTHVEEMFVADLLSVVNTDVIIDRSMPSAIAYGKVFGNSWDKDGNEKNARLYSSESEYVKLFRWWESKVFQAGILIVWLRAPYATANRRSPERANNEWLYKSLDKTYEQLFGMTRLSRMAIDTRYVSVEGIVGCVRERMVGG